MKLIKCFKFLLELIVMRNKNIWFCLVFNASSDIMFETQKKTRFLIIDY